MAANNIKMGKENIDKVKLFLAKLEEEKKKESKKKEQINTKK